VCYSLLYNVPTMLPAGPRPVTWWVHYTTTCNTPSSAPEDGQNNCPKHVELTGIINKPLLLHLVGSLYYLYFIIFFRLAKQSQFNPLQNVVYFITLPLWFVKHSHFTHTWCGKEACVVLLKCRSGSHIQHDMQCNIFPPSRNHYYHDNTTMSSLCIVEFRISPSAAHNIKTVSMKRRQ
jgi:hypothetical protein